MISNCYQLEKEILWIIVIDFWEEVADTWIQKISFRIHIGDSIKLEEEKLTMNYYCRELNWTAAQDANLSRRNGTLNN